MKKMLIAALALAGAFTITAEAQAQSRAIAVTDVNLRAGPSTSYPAVNVVGAGQGVRVFGCLDTRSWCDVGFQGQRGWMSSNYLADAGERRYTGPRYVERIQAPVISFSVGSYWDNHYRGRSFYNQRNRFDDRGGRRVGRREDRRDFREDRRDDRRDFREERRDDRRDFRDDRRDRRGDRAERRDDRRDVRGPARAEPVVPLYRVD
ncbi:SH3 domain-containing protein [Aurantimonas aggregata]|uniref:SH3 domain-containing protein n=1 Tax=Aurantimonas aggregata TaxID=2047720 RepID=A0A6L9MEP9_9HYPH|nr:SH3 domain-containing protein [Aurantimonas aggregata]NDV86289.1 SH3 domain-containing protein [Aurantimonas aggregata]